jgi:beta-N-acetylhexosaminidase
MGGVCLFGDNVESAAQLAALTADLHAAAPHALIAIDEEGGDVTRLYQAVGSPFPGNAVLGRIDDLSLTRAVGEQVGWELRAVGVDFTLAPDVDVNSNPLNPVIGVRSFGDQPALVSRHGAAWIEGVQSTGVAACAKHFPGHGDTSQDSHVALPVVDAAENVVRARDIAPFAAAIEAGVQTIMTSHIVMPAFDSVPATFSSRILQGLLRDELGFDGLIITDALDMAGASADRGIPAAAVAAIAAGADLLCIGTNNSEAQMREIAAALDDAVGAGVLSAERLAEAAGRVRALGAQTAEAREQQPAPAALVTGLVPGLTLERVTQAFAISDSAKVMLEERDGTPLVWLRLEPSHNIAVGDSPWGPFAPGVITPAATLVPGDSPQILLAAASGGLPVVVGKDNHRHAFARQAIAALREQGPVLVVDMGWPDLDQDFADLATYGASRLVGEALVARIDT